jgi:predicted aldo/keto reductase-like oxidoreductase
MQYRQLDRCGIEVSVIGLGCEGFTDKTEEETREMIDFAIENGVNFIDMYTSDPNIRRNIGKAINGRREKMHIQGHLCTIWENNQYCRSRDIEKVIPAFEEQLRLLQTDYLDIGMLHYVDNESDLQTVMDGPILQFALKLKAEGRIHAIGLSSHNPIVAIKAVQSGYIDVLLFSINPAYDMQPATEDVEDLWADENYAHELKNIDPERSRLYALCESMGVGIDVMKVYGGGDLLNADLSPIGKAFTPEQCVDYALRRPGVASVMIGCKSKSEIAQAVSWCNTSEEQRDYTKALQGVGRFSWHGHCMYCGHCAPCAASIDIATVNKYYNLTEAEGFVPETMREHYKLLSHHASECKQCGQCEARCPFGVEIRKAMINAAKRFGY